MLQSLTLHQFRNFSSFSIPDCKEKNFIIGKNGAGKSNILEAICLLAGSSFLDLAFEELVQTDEDYFFLEAIKHDGEKLSVYYSPEKGKIYSINGKKVSKSVFIAQSYTVVVFSPIVMNMLYLGPSLRRDFLDNVLISSIPEYAKMLQNYKKILVSRNKMLKAIRENKAQKSEIYFWDNKFIEISEIMYKHRFQLMKFFEEHIGTAIKYFFGKVNQLDCIYQTKVDRNNIGDSIRLYLEKNLDRDIILGSTKIGVHRDDFIILADNKELTSFASRGETKSIIIFLKMLEGLYIEKQTGKKPILVIDDLLSELDEDHKNMILDKIGYYQMFVSSISQEEHADKKFCITI